MIDPVVRPAAVADAADLADLEAAGRRMLADQRGGPRWLEEHPERGDRWAATVEDPTTPVFVADLDGVVVGYLVLVAAPPIARIEQVYVLPEARELGFGDELVAHAMRTAADGGATSIEGTALPGDRLTKNLYERAGITARLIVVAAALNDPSSAADASRRTPPGPRGDRRSA